VQFSTCDLCDEHRGDVSGGFAVLVHPWRSYGKHTRFCGPVETVQCYEDNTVIKAALEEPGEGRVLVVDAGSSMRKAVLGGNLAAMAARHQWAGLIIQGCVRDLAELAEASVGVVALGHVPMPTQRQAQGLRGEVIHVAGVRVAPGAWIYADPDGVVLSSRRLHQNEQTTGQS
jgi:regulator of ribonuclease activity A